MVVLSDTPLTRVDQTASLDGSIRGDRLTARERQIVDLIALGKTNREIGQDLYLSEKTVKNYVSNLLMKLGMMHRSQVAAYSVRLAEYESRASLEHATYP